MNKVKVKMHECKIINLVSVEDTIFICFWLLSNCYNTLSKYKVENKHLSVFATVRAVI